MTTIVGQLATPGQKLGDLVYDFGQGFIPVYLLGIDVTCEPRAGIILIMKDYHLVDRMRPKTKRMVQLYQIQSVKPIKNKTFLFLAHKNMNELGTGLLHIPEELKLGESVLVTRSGNRGGPLRIVVRNKKLVAVGGTPRLILKAEEEESEDSENFGEVA